MRKINSILTPFVVRRSARRRESGEPWPGAGDQRNLPTMPLASMVNKRDLGFDDETQGEMNEENLFNTDPFGCCRCRLVAMVAAGTLVGVGCSGSSGFCICLGGGYSYVLH